MSKKVEVQSVSSEPFYGISARLPHQRKPLILEKLKKIKEAQLTQELLGPLDASELPRSISSGLGNSKMFGKGPLQVKLVLFKPHEEPCKLTLVPEQV